MRLTIILPFWSFVFCVYLLQAPNVHDLVQVDAFEALERKGGARRVRAEIRLRLISNTHTHPYKVDATGWIGTGEGDRFTEHGEIGPR